MDFPRPLIPARLLRRYKRFLADVELADGRTATVHCPNPGAMLGVDAPGSEIWLSPAASPGRKLPYTWELIRVGGSLVGINTGHPNTLAEEGIRGNRIAELAAYERLRREVNYGTNSRIDLLCESDDGRSCYVEVKNVHLKRADAAEFPDCVTARGTKHLAELTTMVATGHRAVMLYIVQRTDCRSFSIAADIDPAYAAALKLAMRAGVEAICYSCRIDVAGISVDQALPIDI
ncbi:MAG TPA: DNA/RNA nuclease SfsA [Candidatus Acidoferrum sp.]|nr:DNA/RNA nuclease SfsA [Candidatus Acidoferrum sp.]